MCVRARLLSLFAPLLLLSSALLAQGDAKFRLSAAFQPPTAKPGDEVVLVLSAEVAAGYHAYGTKEQTNLPVSLKPESFELGGLALKGAAEIPPGSKKSAFGVDTYPLPNQFVVKQRFTVPSGIAGGEVTVRGTLKYQICDENMCLPPGKAPFEAKLQVAGGAGTAATSTKSAAPSVGLEPGQKIAVRASTTPSPARAGETVTLVLDVEVAETHHAYGTREQTNLPVALDVTKLRLGGMKAVGDAVIPPGEKQSALGVDSWPLPHTFRVTQTLQVPGDAKPGAIELGGSLDYQLCTENHCEMASEIEFATKVVVEAGAARTAAVAVPTEAADEVPPANDSLLAGSLLALILACIGGGLFALVMPCTYPMIPITFSFFTKQADARGGKVMTLALTYGFGIVAMFTTIGALAGVLGSYIVPFAAHWITNVVIGSAFVLFGLSLLGVVTLQPPAFLVQAAGKSRGAGGAVGVLLMGATLVITSFTCTAPVVALLLVPAVQAGSSWKPALGMAVFGLTMALPFVMLALLPGRVKALPRSGEWMNTLKVTLGFVELAAALKFFSNAEYVANLHVLPRETFFGIWIALFVALASYLAGVFPRRPVGTARRVGSLASLAFAGYCLYGALGYPLDFVMTALAPAYGRKDVSKHELVLDDYTAAVEKAKAQKKLVLVNLTGFTCTNCRMVERGILPSDAIAPILVEHFVEARLHMDNESAVAPEKWKVHMQVRHDFVDDQVTTPIYVVVDPTTGKKLLVHVLRGGPSAWEVGYREFLEKALAAAGRSLAAK